MPCPRDEKRGLDLRKFCRDGLAVQYRERGVLLGGADWTTHGGMAQLSTLPLHPLLPFYFPNFFCKPDTQFPTDRAGRGRNMTIDRWAVRAAPMKSIEKSSVTRLGKVLGRESATLHPSPKRPSLPAYLHNWCSPNRIIRSYWHPILPLISLSWEIAIGKLNLKLIWSEI